jgi:HEAT repeat protein
MRTFATLTLVAALLAVAQPMHAQNRRSSETRSARDQLRATIEQQKLSTHKQNIELDALMQHLLGQEGLLEHIVVPELHELNMMLDLERHELMPDMHELNALLDERLAIIPEMHELNALMETEHLAMIPELHALDDARLELEQHLFDVQAPRFEYSDRASYDAALDRLRGDGPRAAAYPQDPADSLWRSARERFNANNFREAARLFGRIRTESRFANSAYRIDAQYWEAYSLSRLGAESDLEQARDLLRNVVRYPPTQRSRDAEGLLVTVDARLARLGNREAEEALVARATEIRVAQNAVQYTQATATADQARYVAEQAAQNAIWDTYGVTQGLNLQGALTLPSLSYSVPRQCRSDEEDIRMVALNALARLDAETALPVLHEVMARRGECSEYLRRQAISVASRHRTPAALELITNAARNDPDQVVRTAALQALLAIDEDRGLGMIEERLRAGADTTTMREAISALSRRTNNERATRMLRDVASRTELPPSLRRDAILSLGRHDDAETRRSLRQLYSQSNDRLIRDAVLAAGTSADAESVDWLLQIALDTNEDERYRQRALSAAARNRAMTAERMVRAFDQFTEPAMRRAAVSLLARQARTERVATDKLLEIARTESDIEVRKAAIIALTSIDDPRARDLLLDILRR